MASVHDVAAYILGEQGPVTAMKLQKLVYYCQAWSLVWDEHPLFPEQIQAWANGPVVRELYDKHRGRFLVEAWPEGPVTAMKLRKLVHPGDAEQIDAVGRETIDAVLGFYGHKSSQWLGELVRQENPWLDARSGLPPGEPSNQEISHAAMAEYYGSLEADKPCTV